jgi:hypothetical protein
VTDLRRTHGPSYYRRIGLTGAEVRWRRTALGEALALGRVDPGPPAGEHHVWVDAWRRARVRFEINRATVG